MPSLDSNQLNSLQQRLDARESELGAEVRDFNAEPDRPGVIERTEVEDDGAVAEQRIRDAIRYAEKERDVEELRDIATARQRMADGSYGDCVDCGVDIPFARLEVQPTAQRCIACQEVYERTHPPGPHILPSLSIPADAS